MFFTLDGVIAILTASIPGIVVAWFASYLNARENNMEMRTLGHNARAQLRLEIDGNLRIVQSYQYALQEMDAGHSTDKVTRLKEMMNNGLFEYALPAWSVVRWEHLPALTLPRFSEKEIIAVELLYQELAEIRALYQHLITFTTTQEREFGTTEAANLRIAAQKLTLFERLETMVALMAQMSNPLQ